MGKTSISQYFQIEKKTTKVFVFNFLSIYLPIISYVTNFFCSKKMVFKKLLYIFLLPIFTLIFAVKSLATYLEGYKSFFK